VFSTVLLELLANSVAAVGEHPLAYRRPGVSERAPPLADFLRVKERAQAREFRIDEFIGRSTHVTSVDGTEPSSCSTWSRSIRRSEGSHNVPLLDEFGVMRASDGSGERRTVIAPASVAVVRRSGWCLEP
jgi:hypothetical protein